MAAVNVTFDRTEGPGLQFSSIAINHNWVDFVGNKALVPLETGRAFLLEWRMAGNPGSKLELEYTVPGKQKKVAIDSTVPDRTRHSQFTFIQL